MTASRQALALWLAAAATAAGVTAAPPPARAATKEFRDAYAAAMSLYDGGKLDLALAAFETARDLAPEPEAFYGIARCLDRLGRTDLALDAYETFLTSAPEHKGAPSARGFLVDLLRAKATAATAAGDVEAARAALERALRTYDRDHGGVPDVTRDAIAVALLSLPPAVVTAVPAGFALTDPLPAPRRATRWWVWPAGGAAALLVAGAGVFLAVVLTRPPVDNGWYEARVP